LLVTGQLPGVVRVVLAADSRLMSDGLESLCDKEPNVEIVQRVDDSQALATVVHDLDPEALLVSLRTLAPAAMSLIREVRSIREEHPALGIIIVADRANGFALELLRGGSARTAYLLDEQLSGMHGLVETLHEVLSGQTVLDPSVVDALVRRRDALSVDHLTIRELEVLEHIAQGLSNRAVGTKLGITIKAVENHVTAIFRKLDLTDRTDTHQRVAAALTFLDGARGPGRSH
jgi:DNA-binding NarL/FixJ family response regulator